MSEYSFHITTSQCHHIISSHMHPMKFFSNRYVSLIRIIILIAFKIYKINIRIIEQRHIHTADFLSREFLLQHMDMDAHKKKEENAV